jgi:hypothetical protein
MELERRGIRVSDEEIVQAARFSPPPELPRGPVLPDRWVSSIRPGTRNSSARPRPTRSFMQQLEAYYRDVIPRSKLMRQVTSGIYVTDAMLWRDFRDQNEQVEVEFLVVDARNWIPDCRGR